MKVQTLTYSWNIQGLTTEQKAQLAACDVIVCADRPEQIAILRATNPDLIWLFQTLPQHAEDWNAAYDADRSWSPLRQWTWKCDQEDYYLRTTSGDRIIDDDGRAIVNWTPYSYASRAWIEMIEDFVAANSWGARGSNKQGIDGLMIEVMCDCLGTFQTDGMEDADPDEDGTAEGVSKYCTGGGNEEPLTLLMRVSNAMNRYKLVQMARSFPVVMNDHVYTMGPSWAHNYRHDIKIKQENWLQNVKNEHDDATPTAYRNEIAKQRPFCYSCYGDGVSAQSLKDGRLTAATALLKGCYAMLSRDGAYMERLPYRVDELDYELGNKLTTVDPGDRYIYMVFEQGVVIIDTVDLDAHWAVRST